MDQDYLDQLAVPVYQKAASLKKQLFGAFLFSFFSTSLVKTLLSKYQHNKYISLKSKLTEPNSTNLKDLLNYRDLLRAGDSFKRIVFAPRLTLLYTLRSYLHENRNSDLFEKDSTSKSVFYNFVFGGFAALNCGILSYLFDYRRSMTANDYSHLINYGQFKKSQGRWTYYQYLSIDQGIHVFWKGFPVYILGQIVKRSISFGLFDTFKDYIKGYQSIPYQLTLGFVSTMISLLAVYPNDIVRRRQIITKRLVYQDAFQCLKGIAREEGVSGLWKGVSHMLVLRSVSGACMLTLFEQIWSYHREGILRYRREGRVAMRELWIDEDAVE